MCYITIKKIHEFVKYVPVEFRESAQIMCDDIANQLIRFNELDEIDNKSLEILSEEFCIKNKINDMMNLYGDIINDEMSSRHDIELLTKRR